MSKNINNECYVNVVQQDRTITDHYTKTEIIAAITLLECPSELIFMLTHF